MLEAGCGHIGVGRAVARELTRVTSPRGKPDAVVNDIGN